MISKQIESFSEDGYLLGRLHTRRRENLKSYFKSYVQFVTTVQI
jgi:hypothetical protein